MKKGICRDIYNKPCSMKDEIQEVSDQDEYICSECGLPLEPLPKSFHEKALSKIFSLAGVATISGLSAIGGTAYWYTLPDTTPPSKPILISEISTTDKSKTSLTISGEEGAKIFIDGQESNKVIDENGEAIVEIDTDYSIGKKRVFSIYLQDEANNSSEKLNTPEIERVEEADNDAPDMPTLTETPTIVVSDNGVSTVYKVIKVKGEVGSKVFVNGEDTGKKILSNGLASIKIKIDDENIDDEFFLKLIDKSGNMSKEYSFVFKKEIQDKTPPEKPTM